MDQLALSRVKIDELSPADLETFFKAQRRPSELTAAERATVEGLLQDRKIGFAADDGLDRQRAIGALRNLTDEQTTIVMKHLESDPYFIHESDHAALDEIFRDQGIRFKTPVQMAKSAVSATADRYQQVLEGRDIRDVDDATFDKASTILTRSIA